MFKVALCGLLNSKHTVDAKISAFLGSSVTGYTILEFETVEELIASGDYYDLYFINMKLRENEDKLFKHLSNDHKPDNKKLRFITYVEDPASDATFDAAIDCLKRHIEYDSMYLAIEFLTDRGLRSIAVSKILYFEYIDRKVKIKTQNNEYYCDDTLRNVFNLVGSYGFLQPHKSFIVNLKNITSIKNYLIKMSDGSTIPLSQKKSKEFRKCYAEYLKEKKPQVKKKPNK